GLLAGRVESLHSDTRYECRIRASDGRFISWVRFRTAPASDGSFLFTVVGDSGHGGIAARAIARHIRAAHPAFLIHVGDLAYPDGTVSDLARAFFPPYRATLRRGAPFSPPRAPDPPPPGAPPAPVAPPPPRRRRRPRHLG